MNHFSAILRTKYGNYRQPNQSQYQGALEQPRRSQVLAAHERRYQAAKRHSSNGAPRAGHDQHDDGNHHGGDPCESNDSSGGHRNSDVSREQQHNQHTGFICMAEETVYAIGLIEVVVAINDVADMGEAVDVGHRNYACEG